MGAAAVIGDRIGEKGSYGDVVGELKTIYKSKMLPLEKLYHFDHFYSPPTSDAEFDSLPHVLLLGQYSVGKTSFINYVLGKEYPGCRIGPEPTTDRFVAIMNGPDERIIPGNALSISDDLPYGSLQKFGLAFANRFEGVQFPCRALEKLTLVDTPGVLSGEKQRNDRGYDFVAAMQWFAERSDLIILLFDAYKLDISDEFKEVLKALHGNEDKVRVILNKADGLDKQNLLRVYGALLWSLGKVMPTPEVLRVYCGSFRADKTSESENLDLLLREERAVMVDFQTLPKDSAVRKINKLIKRARLARVHAYIIGHLKKEMPMMIGKDKKKRALIDTLPEVLNTVVQKHNLSKGDLPPVDQLRKALEDFDFSQLENVKDKLLVELDVALHSHIPRLMDAVLSVASSSCEHDGDGQQQQDEERGELLREPGVGKDRCDGFDTV